MENFKNCFNPVGYLEIYTANLHPYDYLLIISVQTKVTYNFPALSKLKAGSNWTMFDRLKNTRDKLAGKNKLLAECFEININKIVFENL